ncbi:MAG: hypothetical protein Kow00105_18020 [Phycisphaeraceae bacterium]
MNSIDFLPESYHEERAQRLVARRRWVLIVLTALTLVGWGLARHLQSADLARRTEALEAQAQATQQKRSEMAKLRAERQSLQYQLKIQRQLSQPVALSQTVAALGRLLPEGAGLTNLRVVAHRPPPKPKEDPDDKKKSRKKKNDEPDPESLRHYLIVEVSGLAPDDVTVANLVNEMAEHPLFEKVTMKFSRVDDRSEWLARRFQVEAEIPLDRRYLPVARSAEVSDED